MIITAALLCAVSGVRADDDRPVTVSELPRKAQEFIASYFPAEKVSLAKVERDFFERKYEVVFASSAKVEFFKDGEWKEVDCRYTAMPEGIVPLRIAEYVADNYPSQTVVKIDRDKREYEVKLSEGLELTFDTSFNLTDIDR